MNDERPTTVNAQSAQPQPPKDTSVTVRAKPDPANAERPGLIERLLNAVRRMPALDEAYTRADLTPIPPVPEGVREVAFRPVHEPFAYVRVVYEPSRNAHAYQVIEPPLSAAEKAALDRTKSMFLRTIDVDLHDLDAGGARAYVDDQFRRLARRHLRSFSALSRARIHYYVVRDFLGFGPVDPLMRDPEIEDISCDGPGIPVFVYDRRFESARTSIAFENDEALDAFVMQLAQRSGKHVSIADPLVDATLPDGSRLQATLSREVTTRGSTFTVRRFREDPLTPTDLIAFGTVSCEVMAYLWMAVEGRASALIAGGTASGKTTTLNSLSIFIPPEKKVVSIEDTRELNLMHENWIPGVTRAGMGGGDAKGKRQGEVDMYDLLRAALRQRPEYILLGEVRGREAYVLFQAMATGHTAYGTMHADSVEGAVRRLESQPLLIPRNLLTALDLVLVQGQVRVKGRRVRRVREVVEIAGTDARTGELLTNRVFTWDPKTDTFVFSGTSRVLEDAAAEQGKSDAEVETEFQRRVRFMQLLRDREVRDIAGVSRAITQYAIDPEAAARRLGGAPSDG